MHVDDDELRLVAKIGDQLLADAKRIVDGGHEDAAHQIHHADLHAVEREETAAAARRAGRIVRRPDDPIGFIEVAAELALIPDVVAAGDEIDAGGKHFIGGLLGEPKAAGGILAVGDHRVDPMLLACERQMLLQRFATRRTHDVADHEQGDGGFYDRALALAVLPE